jgi:TrmH family RNA methyltransferase
MLFRAVTDAANAPRRREADGPHGSETERMTGMDLPPISSSQNRQVAQVRRYLARPKECRREGILVADGIHLVEEAIRARLSCRALFVSTDDRDPEIARVIDEATRSRLPLYRALPHVFRSLSPVETPQGLVGVFLRPRVDRGAIWGGGQAEGHLAIAHGIQDPANLGSLARSALAAGLRALITSPGTVDPYHHRALRASMGAAFRLPHLVEEPIAPLLGRLKNQGYRTVGLTPRGECELTELDPRQPTALVLGSEGAGLDPAVLASVDARVRIPIHAGVESLGVAAAGAVAFFWMHLLSRNGKAGY